MQQVTIANLLHNIDRELTDVAAAAGQCVDSLLSASNKAVLDEKVTIHSAVEVIKKLREVILEQCTFHDIIVQHTNKIRHDLGNIEQAIPESQRGAQFIPAVGYDNLLSGPSGGGEGLSQDEIDNLF